MKKENLVYIQIQKSVEVLNPPICCSYQLGHRAEMLAFGSDNEWINLCEVNKVRILAAPSATLSVTTHRLDRGR